jgi:hypothetical protein
MVSQAAKYKSPNCSNTSIGVAGGKGFLLLLTLKAFVDSTRSRVHSPMMQGTWKYIEKGQDESRLME